MGIAIANPLAWPEDWPRTPAAKRQVNGGLLPGHRLRGRLPAWSFGAARDALVIELKHLGVESAVLSANLDLGKNDLPIASATAREDPGAAVYFDLDGRQIALACDRYGRLEENMQSIVRTLDTLRQLERQGGSAVLQRALAGFQAIRGPKTCWSVLGLAAGATLHDIKRAYHEKARQAHPDNGGSDAAMAELNRARDEAIRVAR